ncbi:MAG: hypothetical protein ABII27_07625 [bacterium]
MINKIFLNAKKNYSLSNININSKYLTLIIISVSLLSFKPLESALMHSVRVEDFKWKLTSTEHFDIYYYDKSKPILQRVAEVLEDTYKEVGEVYNYFPKAKTPFIIYSNHNEFEQTNIADVGEGTGGLTEAFKNRFTIFNDGSEFWLNQVIKHEYTHVIQFNLLYGGFWKSARLLKSFFYPLWIMEGAAEYSTFDMDKTVRDMYLRDAVTSKGLIPVVHLHNFNHLKPHQITLAYKQSQSIIDFIVDEYGREKIKYILPIAKNKFDASGTLSELVGQDVFTFNWRFMEYMDEKYLPYLNQLHEPAFYGNPVSKKSALPEFNTSPVFFPDGKRIAFVTDKKGYNAIYITDLDTLETEYVLGSDFDKIERIYSEEHALDISPDGNWLLFAGENKQRSYIYKYNLKRKKLRKLKFKLDEVKSPAYSPDGERIVFVGMKDSITDIYMSDIKGHKIKQLTDDTFLDSYPVFADSGHIIYSSESDNQTNGCNNFQKDLYKLNILNQKAERLTFLQQDEINPEVSPDGEKLYFINNQDFIYNIYRSDINGNNVEKLTEIIGGNFNPAISPDGKIIAFSSYRGGEKHIYIGSLEKYAVVKTASGKEEYSQDELPIKYEKEAYNDIDLIRRSGSKYRFKASTDLMFPILFYSSLDGFFGSLYYQASEYLGNHQIQAAATYGSDDDILDYNFIYSYLRFRPSIIVGAGGENYYRDLDRKDKRLEHAQFIAMEYPFSRINSLIIQGTTLYRKERYKDENNYSIHDRENVISANLNRDTTTGKYLLLTSGHRLRFTYEFSDYDSLNSDYKYKNHIIEAAKLFPTGPQSVITTRLMGGVSYGPNQGVFRLGGIDRVKGYSRNSDQYKFSRMVIANFKWEFPIARDWNYYMWYFFPDLFFKSLNLAIFTDVGYGWEKHSEIKNIESNEVMNSAGLGLHFYTFVLQTFQLNLNFDWVKRTDIKGSIFYFTLGPSF